MGQLDFVQFFKDLFFGPREEFEAFGWQSECFESYVDHLKSFRDAFGNTTQHRYCLFAGTGSGKTLMAALIGSHLLNTKLADQLVVVVPTTHVLRQTIKTLYHMFGIELVKFNTKNHRYGVPRTKQGYILTYAHLIRNPELHRFLTSSTSSAVIFDEVHHLGDSNGWGDASKEAFDRAAYIISLTGTPYRSDNTVIPFVTYEDTNNTNIKKFRADYTYSLGRAVADGVCRKPIFVFHRGTVKIRENDKSDERDISFEDPNVNEFVSALRLRGAVKYGSVTRRKMIEEALRQCKEEKRKAIIFLGGDTEGDKVPTEDAKNLLPSELMDMGITADEFEVITGDDSNAYAKLEAFGSSNKWILVSINMVSEGSNIPELSAAIFLTSITAKQTTVQRIGRVLRMMMGDDRLVEALIFMFEDRNYVGLADEMEAEINQEIAIRKKRQLTNPDGHDTHVRRSEAIGIAGGEMNMIKFNGKEYPIAVIDDARSRLKSDGLPATLLHAALTLFGYRR